MVPSRKGVCTEYKRGHYYLTHVEWEDGHIELEVHRCVPELLGHTCDKAQVGTIMKLFSQIEIGPTIHSEPEELEAFLKSLPDPSEAK
jgi:hypothetical protein